jgi:hypothetical protein
MNQYDFNNDNYNRPGYVRRARWTAVGVVGFFLLMYLLA